MNERGDLLTMPLLFLALKCSITSNLNQDFPLWFVWHVKQMVWREKDSVETKWGKKRTIKQIEWVANTCRWIKLKRADKNRPKRTNMWNVSSPWHRTIATGPKKATKINSKRSGKVHFNNSALMHVHDGCFTLWQNSFCVFVFFASSKVFSSLQCGTQSIAEKKYVRSSRTSHFSTDCEYVFFSLSFSLSRWVCDVHLCVANAFYLFIWALVGEPCAFMCVYKCSI